MDFLNIIYNTTVCMLFLAKLAYDLNQNIVIEFSTRWHNKPFCITLYAESRKKKK